MKYRYLGSSGLAVSVIGLGTMTFGQKEWGCDETESVNILNAYTETGGNFIDTADKYADTLSEQIVGKWLKPRKRNDIVLASKCFFSTGPNINDKGLSRRHIINACEASLRRLQTDYIDLYQAHGIDPQTPMQETLEAFDSLIKQGKVRYIGLSNFPAWKVMEAFYIAREYKTSRFISGQYLYNLLKRDIENEIVPAANAAGIGIICWSPLSGGMLSGKYSDKYTPPEGSRISKRLELSKGRYHQWYDNSKKIISELSDIAQRKDEEIASVALAWILGNYNVSSVIVGASKKGQITRNCKSSDFVLDNEDWQKLTDVSSQSVNSNYPLTWIKQNQVVSL